MTCERTQDKNGQNKTHSNLHARQSHDRLPEYEHNTVGNLSPAFSLSLEQTNYSISE